MFTYKFNECSSVDYDGLYLLRPVESQFCYQSTHHTHSITKTEIITQRDPSTLGEQMQSWERKSKLINKVLITSVLCQTPN